MNKTKIEWVKNPDGTQGYTWNPITGCLNGCEYCYARKLANTRLRERYLANENVARHSLDSRTVVIDPFYPRFWEDKLYHSWGGKPKGIFPCDMSDLFGIGIPEEWTAKVMNLIRLHIENRYYLLTKQPQNLIKFSPFPDNCWVGVTATDDNMALQAFLCLKDIKATVKFVSFEPLLSHITLPIIIKNSYEHINMISLVHWVIIGAQTKPYKPPKWEWVREIIEACDKAGVSVFLKENLGLPKYSCEGAMPFYKKHLSGTMELRQEMPREE